MVERGEVDVYAAWAVIKRLVVFPNRYGSAFFVYADPIPVPYLFVIIPYMTTAGEFNRMPDDRPVRICLLQDVRFRVLAA